MSTPYKPSSLARIYYNFRSWNLPWRKKFFRGFDLDGNTFYESYNPLTPNKLRRTVKYVKDGHYTDNNVTPQWMSWLRHTRAKAPTLEELEHEVYRIQSTRANAQLLSQKWEEERARLKLRAPENAEEAEDAKSADTADVVADQEKRQEIQSEVRKQSEPTSSAPSDYIEAPGTKDEKGEWQPESWNPAKARKPIRR